MRKPCIFVIALLLASAVDAKVADVSPSGFKIKPSDSGSTIGFSYTVSGDARFKLDAVAPIVEQVLGTQVQRLARFAATGSPLADR